jgi:peptidyl-prolyl cis-trans isomerase B (cyclophilin B)
LHANIPAGNAVINTTSSFPSLLVEGRGARVQLKLAHSLPTEANTRRTTAVPTNEQRRATAKRKLERQLERRAAQARRRRLYIIIGSIVGAVVVIGAVVAGVMVTKKGSDNRTAAASSSAPSTSAEASPASNGQLPAFAAPANLGANCQYPASAEKASKPVNPPRTGQIPTEPAQVSASMTTTEGNLGLQLDNGKSPCTVNSFASLAQQGYFNDTPCHRLTTTEGLAVLQCGDPTGQGNGGPGYQFANEYPTNQYQPDDPKLGVPVVYPRGTLAMANAGPGTNGSQFFLVYKDSQLPPNYTVFGTVDETGLATLDKIAAAGTADGSQDGKPKADVMIKSIQLD